jgi:hypothetical protein
MRRCIPHLSSASHKHGIFQKQRIFKNALYPERKLTNPQKEQFLSLKYAEKKLLPLLDKRKLLSASAYEIFTPHFAQGVTTAYRSVSQAFDAAKRGNRTDLTDLLPSALMREAINYLADTDTDKSCVPRGNYGNGSEPVMIKIAGASWGAPLPKGFPGTRPSLNPLMILLDFLSSNAKQEKYLLECAKCYKESCLNVDIAFLVPKEPNPDVDNISLYANRKIRLLNPLTLKFEFEFHDPHDEKKVITTTYEMCDHLWTFRRENEEWNVVAMDH